MAAFAHRIALVTLFFPSACVLPQSRADEAITVSRQRWYAICAGVCPDYDVTVWADGRVAVRRPSRVLHGYSVLDDEFRVSRAQVAEFRSKLLPYRPVGEQPEVPLCGHDVSPEERTLVLKVIEIEIRWSGGRHPARLVECENAYADEAIRQALLSVNLYIDGRRRD